MNWIKEVLPFVQHAGGASALIAGLLAAAYFSPVFKKDFLWAAGVVAVLLFAYGVGVHDEAKKRDLQEQALAKKVQDAVDQAGKPGQKDPYDDPRN